MASQKLTSLRNLFKSNRILETTGGKPLQAYCLPGTDAHNSEYIAEADFRVKFLSNFSGSNSYVVVTNQEALLWTDGRYFVQAEKQLGDGWTLQKQGQLDSVTPTEWLCSNLSQGDVVGFDPELLSFDSGVEMKRKLTKLGITAVPITGNLVDEFWTERPKPTIKKLLTLSDSEAGESIASKTERVRAELTKKKCAGGVFAALDDVMWFLNVRGSDISHNPLAFSYLIVENSSIHFFICEKKLDDEIKKHLTGVTLHKYEDFLPWLTEFRKNNPSQKIFVPSDTNFAIGSILSDPSESGTSPIQSMKAVKNTTEMLNMRNSNIRDSAALVEFLYWTEQEFKEGKSYTELEMAEKVDGLRAGYPKFVDLSFKTISAGGDHSALPHYNPVESGEGSRKVHADDVYLVDSGAQYRDGTTDVTRTIFVNYGKACQEFIDHNTLVLKGHICLATTVFPTGLQGIRLDSFSRHALWQAGLDFGHGTGHGVGHFLNVHEGPAGIGYRLKTEGIEAGMVLTIEPGYYLPTKWGIRIENCYEVVSTKVSSGAKNFLSFLPLTLAPIQTTIINKSLLSKDEITWLNDYHDKVLAVTGEYLKSAGKTEAHDWLVEQCKHI